MRCADIYQTLEDRNNDSEIETHGPYFCSLHDDKGQIKHGIKTPWLGEGYYFWDTRKEDAQWWGEIIYNKNQKGYVICHTTYDAQSSLLYDLVGNLSAFDEFVAIASRIKEKKNLKRISFPYVLKYLKENNTNFTYKAVRVCPTLNNSDGPNIIFPYQEGKTPIRLGKIGKVQICFFDKTLLLQPFKIVEKHPCNANFTI